MIHLPASVRVYLCTSPCDMKIREEVLPKSEAGQAVAYALKNWTALTRYLEDGDLSIDNNHTERSLRGIAVGRNNWTFVGSDRGGSGSLSLFFYMSCRTCRFEFMAIDLAIRDNAPPADPHWFGVAGSALAWLALGVGDILITWRACLHPGLFGGPVTSPSARILYLVVTLVLIGLAVMAGLSSYRNWKALSDQRELLRAEGRERTEFIAFAGLFMSFTLGFGMLWFCLPLFVIQTCLRAR